MKTYKVLAKITIGAYAHVSANSLEAAQDAVEDLTYAEYTLLKPIEIEPFEIEFEGEYDPDN
jgi:hypothetical protein